MYCIEKYILAYTSSRLRNIISDYFEFDENEDYSKWGSAEFVDFKYKNSTKGIMYLNFLMKLLLPKIDYVRNNQYKKDLIAILKFLTYKSHTTYLMPNNDAYVETLCESRLQGLNATLWELFLSSRSVHSYLGKYFVNMLAKDPKYYGGLSLTYSWVLFEVQYRLTKAEKKIWEQGPDAFMQYVYGKLAILQLGK